jgi:cytochrome b561
MDCCTDVVAYLSSELPFLIYINKNFSHNNEEIHKTFGSVDYDLIALHALACSWSSLFLKHDTLKHMLQFKEHSGIQP